MSKKIKDEKLRIKCYPIGLRSEQIEWIKNNNLFEINRFVRDRLDKYIEETQEIKKI